MQSNEAGYAQALNPFLCSPVNGFCRFFPAEAQRFTYLMCEYLN